MKMWRILCFILLSRWAAGWVSHPPFAEQTNATHNTIIPMIPTQSYQACQYTSSKWINENLMATFDSTKTIIVLLGNDGMMMSRIENVLGPTPLLRLPCFFYVALAFPYFHRRIEKERWWFAKLKQRYWWSVLNYYVIIQIMMMLIAPRGDWGGIRRFLHSCSHLGEL